MAWADEGERQRLECIEGNGLLSCFPRAMQTKKSAKPPAKGGKGKAPADDEDEDEDEDEDDEDDEEEDGERRRSAFPCRAGRSTRARVVPAATRRAGQGPRAP